MALCLIPGLPFQKKKQPAQLYPAALPIYPFSSHVSVQICRVHYVSWPQMYKGKPCHAGYCPFSVSCLHSNTDPKSGPGNLRCMCYRHGPHTFLCTDVYNWVFLGLSLHNPQACVNTWFTKSTWKADLAISKKKQCPSPALDRQTIYWEME